MHFWKIISRTKTIVLFLGPRCHTNPCAYERRELLRDTLRPLRSLQLRLQLVTHFEGLQVIVSDFSGMSGICMLRTQDRL